MLGKTVKSQLFSTIYVLQSETITPHSITLFLTTVIHVITVISMTQPFLKTRTAMQGVYGYLSDGSYALQTISILKTQALNTASPVI
jgi:hypothetical protein